jgi:hypothetical protein
VKIGVLGAGVVSPAGWGIEAFRAALDAGVPLPAEARERAGREGFPSLVRAVPKPEVKLPFFRDPRLRRVSPAGRFVAGAALEALGEERIAQVKSGDLRLGVVTTLFCGCVNYSQRFYREVLEDPHTASPIVFPETVFNAPSSHLSAMLGSHAINYTMIGDTAEFLCGLEVAAGWLFNDEVDGCLVVCTEEFDWLTAEAMDLFEPGCVMGEGGAALYLEKGDSPEVALAQVAGPELITERQPKVESAKRVHDAVVMGDAGIWLHQDATREILGEGLGAAAGWQCLVAVESARRGGLQTAVNVTGLNEHCAAAVFEASPVLSESN